MTELATDTFIISDDSAKQIEHWLAKFPADQRRSACIAALLIVQEQNDGWLSDAAMKAVADYLQIPEIEVYEVATFYDMYELKPVGKHTLKICTNVSCMLRGADELVECAKKRLGVGLGETSKNGKITLQESQCLACCGGAPMCQVDNKAYHENLTEESLLALIDQLEASA